MVELAVALTAVKAGQMAFEARAAIIGTNEAKQLEGISARKLKDLIEDSNKDFRLTGRNARLALESPYGATRVEVVGVGADGADVLFFNSIGEVILRREVKCVGGGYNSFNRHLSRATTKQVYGSGDIFVQVKKGTDINSWLRKFRSTPNRNMDKYKNNSC